MLSMLRRQGTPMRVHKRPPDLCCLLVVRVLVMHMLCCLVVCVCPCLLRTEPRPPLISRGRARNSLCSAMRACFGCTAACIYGHITCVYIYIYIYIYVCIISIYYYIVLIYVYLYIYIYILSYTILLYSITILLYYINITILLYYYTLYYITSYIYIYIYIQLAVLESPPAQVVADRRA